MYYKLFNDLLENTSQNPLYYFLSISNICNAKCKFCDIHEKKEKESKLDVKEILKDVKNNGGKYIHFTGGGEPLANKKIYEYFEYATLLGLNIVFITNGFFLTKSNIKKLKKYNIKAIFFSIDSFKSEIHDSIRGVKGIFDIATKAINLIKNELPNVKIVINHVLNFENIDDFGKFIEMKKTVEYDYLNPIIIKECPEYYFSKKQIEYYNKNIKKYKQNIKKYNIELLYDDINYFEENLYSDNGDDYRKEKIPCKILKYTLFIDCVSGNVYPCDCSVHRDEDYYAIGNLIDNPLNQIIGNKKYIMLLKELEIECSKCKSKCDSANIYMNKKIYEKK